MLLLLPVTPTSVFADETLDVDRSKPDRTILHVCDPQGKPIRPLVQDLTLRSIFDRQGSPDVSSDGKWVAFDAWPSGDEYAWDDARIIVAEFEGTEARNICDGVMPSFSPDGKKLVCSRASQHGATEGARGGSIWMMNSDGTDRKMIADHGAWSASWSTDGKFISFIGGVDDDGRYVASNCVRLYDVETEKIRLVMDQSETPFNRINIHFRWSPLGRELAMTGRLSEDNRSVLAVIDVDRGIESLRFGQISEEQGRSYLGGPIDWHVSGQHILGASKPSGLQTILLNDSAADVRFVEIEDELVFSNVCYTPDGKHIIAGIGAPSSD